MNNKEQAGAELCQAHVKLGIANTELCFHLIENIVRLLFTKQNDAVVFHLPK